MTKATTTPSPSKPDPVFDDEEEDKAGAPAAPGPTQGKESRTTKKGSGAATPGDNGESSRFARDFETDIETDEFADKWISGGTLPEIPARPGFVQRYVNTLDATNHANQVRRGWTPRRADTLPEGFKATPTIQSGDHQGQIGVNGQVLMEMPIKLFQRHQEAQREATKRLESVVESDLYRVRGPGMAATPKEATTRVSVGRVPKVPD